LSKVKYPDREKIRNQIDIILDKSDLFNDSQDKTIHTDNKIVELKPVREKIPVMRVIQFVATAAAIVIFVVAVKNYSVVNKKTSGIKSQIPLATGSADGPDAVYTREAGSSDAGNEADTTSQIIYGDIAGINISKITSNYYSQNNDSYSYQQRVDNVLCDNGTTFKINIPYQIKKDGKLVEGADEIAAELIHQSLIEYINATDVVWKDEVTVRCELSGDNIIVYIDDGKYGYAGIIQE
jgi:hypothetical protein